MLNVCTLIGRVATEPELKYTKDGVAVCTYRLAVDRGFNSPTTGKKETDFIDITCWRSQAECAANYVTKGRLVAVVGSLQISTWKHQDGTNRRKAEVVGTELRFLDYPKGSAQADMQEARTSQPEPQLVGAGVSRGQTDIDTYFDDPFADE